VSTTSISSGQRAGLSRDTMKTLMMVMMCPSSVQAPLGQTRSRGLSVPGPDFTFGMSTSRDGGVAEGHLRTLLHVLVKLADSASHRPVVPDFVSLNRDAVKSGLVTSKELSHDVQVMDLSTRPPSPLADLLSHQYARRWLDEQLSRNQTRNQEQLHRVRKADSETRMPSLRALPVTQPLFKLPRFTQVPAALDTFRDEEARLRAFRAHQSDSVSRRGHQGLGTYSLD
uniref:Uncharacterized protein n=1 Tax=Monopterus albus TaxID=43700 RepID=A0A3Q3IJ09_MONAL